MKHIWETKMGYKDEMESEKEPEKKKEREADY